MTEFRKEQALARYIALCERRHAEFDQLPDVERRIARGDYEFFSSVGIELGELEREAQRYGFVLEWNWDGLCVHHRAAVSRGPCSFFGKRAGTLKVGWIAAQFLPLSARSERTFSRMSLGRASHANYARLSYGTRLE